jgi:hypothetical protein
MFVDKFVMENDMRLNKTEARDLRQVAIKSGVTPAEARALLAHDLRIAAKSGTGQVLPLLPRHDVYLTVRGGDGPRFASVFLTTWKRLPLRARRRILGHWRNRYQEAYFSLSPIIELQDCPIRDEALGIVSMFGHWLRFYSEPINKLPDDVLQDLIAHELAHVEQDAAGIRCVKVYPDGRADFTCRDGSYFGGNFEIEEDADTTMEDWGFDPESIDRWSIAIGRSRIVEVRAGSMEEIEILRRMERHGR